MIRRLAQAEEDEVECKKKIKMLEIMLKEKEENEIRKDLDNKEKQEKQNC